MPTTYPPLSIGAPNRLARFKREAADPARKWVQPMTWRDVRFATLRSVGGFSQGFNGEGRAREAVWSAFHGDDYFRKQLDAHELRPLTRHQGWFTDSDCNEAAIGIVAVLSHGRFLAGYRWTTNDERVYFAEVFTDEDDAARMADKHARVFAEVEREHSERFDAAQKLEIDISDALTRLNECIALRHRACMEYVRDEARELIESIREMRDTLRTDYAGVL